jgi:hypothetical protein
MPHEIGLAFTNGDYGQAVGSAAREPGFFVVSEQDDDGPSSPVKPCARSCRQRVPASVATGGPGRIRAA